jgi:hypothetical protein
MNIDFKMLTISHTSPSIAFSHTDFCQLLENMRLMTISSVSV